MNDTSKAQLFRAAQRSGNETECWRSLHCFSRHTQRCTETLQAVVEHTIAGKASVSVCIAQDTLLLLVPTVGVITYTDSVGCRSSITAGQAYLCFLPKNSEVVLGNPYEDQLVSVLQINLLSPPGARPKHHIYDFDLTINPDCLVDVLSYDSQGSLPEACTYALRIGKFAGRSEAVCRMAQAGQRLFVYVIEGAFEVQYRLMERGDGLVLWNANEIELEALSNEAVVLLLELPG